MGDNLILSCWFSNVVQVWDLQANAEVAIHGSNFPLNAIEYDGHIVVAEFGSGSVVGITGGLNVPGFAVPGELATDGDNLYVADWALGTVSHIASSGVPVGPFVVATGLDQPEGLAVDLDGSLLVVENGAGRLSRIRPMDTVCVVADGFDVGVQAISGYLPTWTFHDVAVAPSGAIYMTSADNGLYWSRGRSKVVVGMRHRRPRSTSRSRVATYAAIALPEVGRA